MKPPEDVPQLQYASPLDDALDPGEQLLWTGQPRPGIRFAAADLMLIPFSLMWGGFSFFWESMALRILWSHPRAQMGLMAWLMPLWGVPFVLVGIYMIAGRFFVDASRRRRTWYGVTDRRAIIVTRWWTASTVSINLRTLGELTLSNHRDGSGTITFGSTLSAMPAVALSGRNQNRPTLPAFQRIPDAQTVCQIIREVQAELGAAPAPHGGGPQLKAPGR